MLNLVLQNDDICIEDYDVYINNDDLYIRNDELYIKNECTQALQQVSGAGDPAAGALCGFLNIFFQLLFSI